MSHHFDTPTAQADPRINICDFYLFAGPPGSTVMAMTVNPDAGLSAPDSFRDEAIYAFRFDLDGDVSEDVTFKVRFGAVEHTGGNERHHTQTMQVFRATGDDARHGIGGDLVAAGGTGVVVDSGTGVQAFAGLAPDLFAGDAGALGAFRTAFFGHGRFQPDAFQKRNNFFLQRNVTAIVIEVPSDMIGAGLVHGWTTASLFGHAPELQVSRWGLPLVTNVFMPDADMKEQFNRATPMDDHSRFIAHITGITTKLTMLAGSASDPEDHARQLVVRLFPTMLPYELGTAAVFSIARFNGRALADDVMDVILTLATKTTLDDGVSPDRTRIRDSFPYFGEPYTSAEQAGLAPARAAVKKTW